jgi:hypothetical protein
VDDVGISELIRRSEARNSADGSDYTAPHAREDCAVSFDEFRAGKRESESPFTARKCCNDVRQKVTVQLF